MKTFEATLGVTLFEPYPDRASWTASS